MCGSSGFLSLPCPPTPSLPEALHHLLPSLHDHAQALPPAAVLMALPAVANWLDQFPPSMPPRAFRTEGTCRTAPGSGPPAVGRRRRRRWEVVQDPFTDRAVVADVSEGLGGQATRVGPVRGVVQSPEASPLVSRSALGLSRRDATSPIKAGSTWAQSPFTRCHGASSATPNCPPRSYHLHRTSASCLHPPSLMRPSCTPPPWPL